MGSIFNFAILGTSNSYFEVKHTSRAPGKPGLLTFATSFGKIQLKVDVISSTSQAVGRVIFFRKSRCICDFKLASFTCF